MAKARGRVEGKGMAVKERIRKVSTKLIRLEKKKVVNIDEINKCCNEYLFYDIYAF